jgi:pimeloyl-ACP methyl ester carboxylesterase
MRRASIFLIILSLFPLRGFSSAAKPVNKFELGACTIPSLPPEARCGTCEVWENRAAKSGRKIPLQVLVLPATGPERLPDPLTYFSGGPGTSSIDAARWWAAVAPELRKNRDFLVVDARGTGRSAALVCDELRGPGGIQGYLDDYMPAGQAHACRDRLRKTVDLTQYSIENVVDDAEEVRAALGYGKINLMGGSYGTRPVQVYMRRHPGSIRTALMIGVLPLDEPFPLVTARYAQQSLNILLAECAGDPACRQAFPKLREEVAAVFLQVGKEPLRIQVAGTRTGQPLDLVLSRNGLAQVLRRMLYQNNWIELIPLYVHLAAAGNWQPLAEIAQVVGSSQSDWAEGYFLATTCSEDLAFVREEEIPAAVAGTFLGDLRVRRQLAACAGWPAAKLGAEFHAPVTSDIPTLLISGGADPATPPSLAERVARTLKRSRHVVIPDGGHDWDGMTGADTCANGLIAQLIRTGTVESLDTSCVARTKRPDFLLRLEPEVRLKPGELERLAGTYMGKDGLKAQAEIVGGYLRVTHPNGSDLLAATSPARFRRRDGEREFRITFGLQDGRAVSLTLEEPYGTTLFTREGS